MERVEHQIALLHQCRVLRIFQARHELDRGMVERAVHIASKRADAAKRLGRSVNRSGTNQPLNVMGNPIPYFPANSADNTDAVLKVHTHETLTGVVTEGDTIPNTDWKFCYGSTATFAAPGSPQPGAPNNLPVRVCLGAGRTFDPAKLYQLVYTVT